LAANRAAALPAIPVPITVMSHCIGFVFEFSLFNMNKIKFFSSLGVKACLFLIYPGYSSKHKNPQ
jgi:hypothetical protein